MPKERTTSESQLGYFFECCQKWYPSKDSHHPCLGRLRQEGEDPTWIKVNPRIGIRLVGPLTRIKLI